MRKLLTLLAILTAVAGSLLPVLPASAASRPDLEIAVIVSFTTTSVPEQRAIIEKYDGKLKRTYRKVAAAAARIPAGKLDALRSEPAVKSVEEDTKVKISAQSIPWGIDRVEAQTAHAAGNKGQGVRVAILDTGISLAHPDLRVTGGVTFVDGTTTADDDNGHGTMVAGVLAALDNGVGVVGVAPEAQIYSVKVLNSEGSGSCSDILAGIEWSIDNGMQVVNMSFGSTLGLPSTIVDAMRLANESGIVLVSGAGNNGSGDYLYAPARYDMVIAVGATDNSNTRAAFSNTGLKLELMAPGVGISTTTRGGYATGEGSSLAVPHVSGLAALLIATGASGAEARTTLQTTARDLGLPGRDTTYGFGLASAVAATAPTVSQPPPPPAPAPTPTPSPTPSPTPTPTPAPTPTPPPVVKPMTVNLTAVADTYIRAGARNANEGDSPILRIQGGGDNRVLLQFAQQDIARTVAGGTLVSAKLQLDVTRNGNGWGKDGRMVEANRLSVAWTEGNGKNEDLKARERARGTGPGATWECATDLDIANGKPDGMNTWEMGKPKPPAVNPWALKATAGALITKDIAGQVEWDVTADVAAFLSGTANYGWILSLAQENRSGQVDFSSREGLSPPRLVITSAP